MVRISVVLHIIKDQSRATIRQLSAPKARPRQTTPAWASSQRNEVTLLVVARQEECRFDEAIALGPATEPCG